MAGSYRTQGIVLRRTKLGESDLIVTLLCDSSRQIRAVAKGARKPGSRLAGAMNLGNEVEMLLHMGRSLDVVSEARLVTSRAEMARDVEHATMVEAILDCAAELTAEGEHDVRLLPLTSTALDAAVASSITRLPLIVSAYVLKATAMQGFRPSFETCVRCGDEVDLSERGTTLFDLAEGGVVCRGCAGIASGHAEDNMTLGWLRALLGMRFSDLVSWNPERGAQEMTLGLELLHFAQRWLGHYPGIRPRALDFALNSGLY